MTPVWVQYDQHALSPKKKWCVRFYYQGWGQLRYLPPRLGGDIATRTAIALDSSFNFRSVSKILVFKDLYLYNHVIIGIIHGWVYMLPRRTGRSRWLPGLQVDAIVQDNQCVHDGVMTWKRTSHWWPFVTGILRSLVHFHRKGPVMRRFDMFAVVILNNLLTNCLVLGICKHHDAQIKALYYIAYLKHHLGYDWLYPSTRMTITIRYGISRKLLGRMLHQILIFVWYFLFGLYPGL